MGHAPKSITIALVACVAMASSSSLRGKYGVGGRCFKDSYGFADYICPHGYENEHGKCQKYTKVFAPRECPHGFHFPHKWDKCAKEGHEVCPHGFKSSGYKCVTEKVMYAAKKCVCGFEHLQGSCFKFAAYECPHQYEWSSHTKKCFKESYGFADYICPHGYENEHGKCQKYTKVFAPKD